MAAARQKFQFRGNSRQRIQRVGTFPFTLGGNLSVELPRVGNLAGIHVALDSGLTRGGADTGGFSDQMANIIKRFRVNLNIGASQIFDVSGHGVNLLNQAMSFNFGMDKGGDGNASIPAPLTTTADPLVWSGLAANPQVNSPLVFTWWIPIAMNDGLNFNVGLINLQAPEIRCTLDMDFGNIADLFEPGSVITGTSLSQTTGIIIHYLYYEVPNPDLVELPPYIVHRVLQERQSIAAVGDQVYTVPRMGQLQRLIHSVQINGLTSTGEVTDLVIRVNKTDDVYRMTQQVNRWLSNMRYGHKPPRGAFYHDWWRAADLNASGDFRDVIDTERISTLESIVGIRTAAVLGQGNNFLDTIREFTQKLS